MEPERNQPGRTRKRSLAGRTSKPPAERGPARGDIIEPAAYLLPTTPLVLAARPAVTLGNLMKTNLDQALGDLQGAVVTRVETASHQAMLVLAREGRPPLRILLEGCPYQDTRCTSCSCDPDSFRLTIT